MSLKITRAGIFDTIQDSGRKGYQHLGINPGGAMDAFAAQMANALLGKDLSSPVFEMHYPASTFRFEQPAVCCITGADFSPGIQGKGVPLYQPFAVPAGAVLEWQGVRQGSWCYLSLVPEMKLEPWMGSYSTHTKAMAGGWKGRKLQKEDQIDFTAALKKNEFITEPGFTALNWKAGGLLPLQRIGFLKGAEWKRMSRESQQELEKEKYIVTRQSDRMGYRLAGKPLELRDPSSMLSSAVPYGTIQLLPDGQMIVLMADHQTTGGYPRIAYVITAHLPYVAQLQPGAALCFEQTTLEQAGRQYFQQQVMLADLQQACALKMKKLTG